MCSIGDSQENIEVEKKVKKDRQKNANTVGNIMNTYKNFGQSAVKTPVNLLEIKKNTDNYSDRIQAILNGEDDPAARY
tara:strand:+ start:294 stop:527 length:234 start_codon:yes stop_codon:yes gene_type:complete